MKAIDFTTSTHMGVAVRYKREDPGSAYVSWLQRRRIRRCSSCPLGSDSSPGNGHAEFHGAGVSNVARSGIRRFCLADPMNDADSNIACARMIRDGGGEYVIAALVFTLSPIHDDAYYAERRS